MRVVVTGGLGFIGSHLSAALRARGYAVTAVDDLSAGAAPAAARTRVASDGTEVVIARAEDALAGSPLDGADALVHLAAVPGVRARVPPRRLAARNVGLVERLLDASSARGLRFVLASTSSVYGDADALPTPEDASPRPLNPYAWSKLAAEQACQAAVAERGADAVIVRLFTVFGPHQRPDMAFSRWIAGLAEGRPLPWCARPGAAREFTYVGDAVRGVIAALEHGRRGEAYNLAGCGSISVRAALAEIESLLGAEAGLEPVATGVREATATAACGRKASRELGYEPRVGLGAGLRLQLQLAADAALSRPAVAA